MALGIWIGEFYLISLLLASPETPELTQQKWIFSRFWSLEVQAEGVGQSWCFLKAGREKLFHAAPRPSGGFWQSGVSELEDTAL